MRKLIEKGNVLINGKPIKPSYRLQAGETVEVQLEKKPDLELVPYDFPLDIVHEDEDIIVINKPSGLVVHPACGHQEDTLINALVAYNKTLSKGSESFRPGLVHRIDKGTSGLLVLAKNETAHSFLAKLFLQKNIHRRYWAIVFGRPRENQGTIESFITRDPGNRKRFIASEDKKGKWAVSHYKLLAENDSLSLLELSLETGRTHQIRVHLSSLNMPIIGDDVYNGKKRARNLKNQKIKNFILNSERFALHAKELGFRHPNRQEVVRFNSPIPDDLKEIFQLCGFDGHL